MLQSKFYYGDMKKIPFYPQQNSYYCGPATLQMILAACDIQTTQRALAQRAHTNKKMGTSAINMIKTLKHFKLSVRAGNRRSLPQIAQALTSGKLVIICYTEPFLEWGHYAIVQALTDTFIHLLDSDAHKGKTTLTIEEFKHRWKDPLFTKTIRWAAFVEKPKSLIQAS